MAQTDWQTPKKYGFRTGWGLEGRSQRIDTVGFTEDKPIMGWIAEVDFPVLLFRQVFKNKSDSSR